MRLLVCVDDDAQYEPILASLDWCLDLDDEDRVFVCHVVAPLRWMPGWVETEKTIMERVDDFLARTVRLVAEKGPRAEPLRVEGDIAVEILKAAEEQDVQLIVLGAIGQARTQDFLVGSVAEKVESLTGRDLLLVRGEATTGEKGFRALLAVDGSDASLRAVERFAETTKARDAAIRILHVIEAPPTTWDVEIGRLEDDTSADPPALREMAERAMRDASEILRRRDLEATTSYRRGTASGEILQEAKNFEADLIVMGSLGAKPRVPKPWRGIVAKRVARHAACSVFIASFATSSSSS